jgi:hypothetical protein
MRINPISRPAGFQGSGQGSGQDSRFGLLAPSDCTPSRSNSSGPPRRRQLWLPRLRKNVGVPHLARFLIHLPVSAVPSPGLVPLRRRVMWPVPLKTRSREEPSRLSWCGCLRWVRSRVVTHARYDWLLLLSECLLTKRLFGSMVRRIAAVVGQARRLSKPAVSPGWCLSPEWHRDVPAQFRDRVGYCLSPISVQGVLLKEIHTLA